MTFNPTLLAPNEFLPLKHRLEGLSQQSLALVKEVAVMAAKARALSLTAAIATEATDRDDDSRRVEDLLEQVGSLAGQAENSVQRAAELIGESSALATSESSPFQRTQARVLHAIAALNEFASAVKALHEAMEQQMTRAR
jgi:hypothetical protein